MAVSVAVCLNRLYDSSIEAVIRFKRYSFQANNRFSEAVIHLKRLFLSLEVNNRFSKKEQGLPGRFN